MSYTVQLPQMYTSSCKCALLDDSVCSPCLVLKSLWTITEAKCASVGEQPAQALQPSGEGQRARRAPARPALRSEQDTLRDTSPAKASGAGGTLASFRGNNGRPAAVEPQPQLRRQGPRNALCTLRSLGQQRRAEAAWQRTAPAAPRTPRPNCPDPAAERPRTFPSSTSVAAPFLALRPRGWPGMTAALPWPSRGSRSPQRPPPRGEQAGPAARRLTRGTRPSCARSRDRAGRAFRRSPAPPSAWGRAELANSTETLLLPGLKFIVQNAVSKKRDSWKWNKVQK